MESDHLQEFKEFLEKTKGLSEKTVSDYCYWIRDLDPASLSQNYLNDYVQRKGNSSGVRGAVERFLEMTGLLKTFDMPPKISGRTKKRIIRDVLKEEIETVRSYLYKQAFKKGLIFDLVYQGALRRAEVTTVKLNSFQWMRWFDDPTKPCILQVIGKGDKERPVLVNPETAQLIFDHYNKKYMFKDMDQVRAWANSNSLLFTIDGKRISQWYVWRIVNQGSLKSISRNIRTHELRHARATEMERMGVPIRDIKNYLGHSSLATTEIYLHRSEKESIDNIQNILNQRAEKKDNS